MNGNAGVAPQRICPTVVPRATSGGFGRLQSFLRRVGVLSDVVVGITASLLAMEMHSLWGKAPVAGNATYIACCGLWFIVVLANWAERRRRHRAFFPWIAARNVAVISTLVFSLLFFDRTLGTAASRLSVLMFAVIGLLLVWLWHQLASLQGEWLYGNPGGVALIGDPVICAELALQMESPLGGSSPHILSHPGAPPEPAPQLLSDLENLLRTADLDEVLFVSSMPALDPSLASLWHGVLELCEATGTRLRVYSRWTETHGHVYLDVLGSVPILTFSFAPESQWKLLMKRFLDIVLASIGLVLAAPVIALAGIAVRVESDGPVIFSQTRCGLRGRPFTLYKLRSMRRDAEKMKAELSSHNEMDGPVFKMTRDPRITRVGRFLRRSSIDELPQLYNVLRGEMSLVGPRPPLPSEVSLYSLADLRRLAMKPGITGLWQVSGRNSVSSFKDWVELDAAYIRQWSLWLDCKILLKTVIIALRMTGK